MQKPTETVQVALRVPIAWVDRLDTLAKALSRPGIEMTRTDSLRAALAEGLRTLEREMEESDG